MKQRYLARQGSSKKVQKTTFGPSEVRAPAVGVAHAGGERSVHY